ncbi:MAG: efflux RND transporter permease subunit [Gammaproteobacteria bacterium]|jgi:HAE1 family hydrophobic/amphiphilic exporter-1|nr:efflux RND transporter permease subunit [Gammaproteobacteria bacterium]
MSLVEVAVRRPVTVAMGAITLLLFGLLALGDLPVYLLSDLTYPSLTVRTKYPGAAPAEIEVRISRPAEELLSTLGGIKRLCSIADADHASYFLESARVTCSACLHFSTPFATCLLQAGETIPQGGPRLRPLLPKKR